MNVAIIQNKIYEVRGQKVMLDFDLAALYQTETKYLKRAVRQNMKRFPADFMFELTKDEYDSLRCSFSTLNSSDTLRTKSEGETAKVKADGLQPNNRGKHRKYLPFAFTEHGVTMLASVISSDKAIDMNIAIVRAFIGLKQLVTAQKDFVHQLQEIRKELHQRIDVHDAQLNQIYEAIENMLDEKADQKAREDEWRERNRIGFKK